ncbi:MAG TPA: response regulator [Bacteroidota bacterium]|nr:response regulator [Bacteroidota bacterium]
MAEKKTIRVLLVEDNADFAKLVSLFLARFEDAHFSVTWKSNATEALAEVERDSLYDVILMDYFLPGLNGLEATKTLREKNIPIPVVFLTVNKDMHLAVEVMKLGVEDYLIKEEISTPILPKTILSVVEKRRLEMEVAELEIRQKRLEAMQELIVGITNELASPLGEMHQHLDEFLRMNNNPKVVRYLNIIKENIDRISNKMEKLRNLREDKTVQYIKNIKMIDLS